MTRCKTYELYQLDSMLVDPQFVAQIQRELEDALPDRVTWAEVVMVLLRKVRAYERILAGDDDQSISFGADMWAMWSAQLSDEIDKQNRALAGSGLEAVADSQDGFAVRIQRIGSRND